MAETLHLSPSGFLAPGQVVPFAGLTALAALAVVAWRLGATLGRRRRPPTARPFCPFRFLSEGERASVMLDFILTFPVFLMIVLVVVQMALAINARLMVGWAAYAAARSAVVNTDGGLDTARGPAERAAALATMPISPSIRAFEYPDPTLLPIVLTGHENPRLPGNRLGRRWLRSRGKLAWARRATDVEISGAGEDGRFAPTDPVRVTVTHRYHLNVPWAGEVFAALRGGWWFGKAVTPIRETVTLTNQGRIVTTGPVEHGGCVGFGNLLDLVLEAF